MAKDLYVRIKPKSPATTFMRGGLLWTLLWVFAPGLDDATAAAIEGEQMLETSTEKPEGFDEQEAAAAEAAAAEEITRYGDDGLLGSSVLASNVEFSNGFSIALGDLVQSAFAASHLSVNTWNGLPAQDRDLLLQSHAEGLRDAFDAGNAANEAVKKHSDEVASLKSQITNLQGSLSTVTSERDGLKTSLSSVTSERDILKGKVTDLEAQLVKATAKPAAAKTGAKAAGAGKA